MSYHEERFTTPDGLSVYGQRWLPEPPAGAVVVLVHGFVEHSGRYAPLAEDLNRQGYAVYAMDLRGHGRSEGPRCFVRRFDQYLEDLDLFLDRVAAAEPDKPLFLLGHSMGGLIVARWAISRPARQADLRGLILSGPALRVGRGLFPLLRHLAWIASLLAPRLPVVRLGGRRICATRPWWKIFAAIRWFSTIAFPCGWGRKSWPPCVRSAAAWRRYTGRS